ncbi:hypothetical protein D3C71_1807840 [compost metagenome]
MAHFDLGVGRRARQGAAAHDRQIGPVVAHRCGLAPLQAQGLEYLFCGRVFVFSAKNRVLHPQGLQAQPQRCGITARDHCRGNARLLQQLEAVPVQGVEPLEGLARLAEVQAAIRQHTIDIKKSHAHVLGAQQ